MIYDDKPLDEDSLFLNFESFLRSSPPNCMYQTPDLIALFGSAE